MILLGTAGFSYADWRGVLYPDALPARDMLAFYATRFSAVELDFTYYRMPTAATLGSMARRTPPGFEFCVKAFRGMTHELPEDPGDIPATFHQFLEALRPLHDNGKLGCVLLQFPWAFRCGGDSREYLETCAELLRDVPTVVEFRNSEWVADPVREDVLGDLRRMGFGFCAVDEPRLKGLMPPLAATTSPIGYVRFHGRNAAKWWKHEAASERYDYLYTAAELSEWTGKIERLAQETDKTYVFFNNCHAGHAATNAAMMAGLLGLDPES
ncbi:MAG: DUF72 domain-containing protein [Bacillota bacterium]|nr:DUF72 domain-containing protein [Bacillota bacterium]